MRSSGAAARPATSSYRSAAHATGGHPAAQGDRGPARACLAVESATASRGRASRRHLHIASCTGTGTSTEPSGEPASSP